MFLNSCIRKKKPFNFSKWSNFLFHESWLPSWSQGRLALPQATPSTVSPCLNIANSQHHVCLWLNGPHPSLHGSCLHCDPHRKLPQPRDSEFLAEPLRSGDSPKKLHKGTSLKPHPLASPLPPGPGKQLPAGATPGWPKLPQCPTWNPFTMVSAHAFSASARNLSHETLQQTRRRAVHTPRSYCFMTAQMLSMPRKCGKEAPRALLT